MSEFGAEKVTQEAEPGRKHGAVKFSLRTQIPAEPMEKPEVESGEQGVVTRRGAIRGLAALAAAALTGSGGVSDAKAQEVTAGERERFQRMGQEKINAHIVSLKKAFPALAKDPYSGLEFTYTYAARVRSRIVTPTYNGTQLKDAEFHFNPHDDENNRFEQFLSAVFPIYAREGIAPTLRLNFSPATLRQQLESEGFEFFGTGRCFLYSKDEHAAYEMFDKQTKEASFTLQSDGSLELKLNDVSKPVRFQKRGGRWAIVE